jgi:hypothetical protein
MKKFKVLYHAPKSVMEQKMAASPEDMKKQMDGKNGLQNVGSHWLTWVLH